jgi:hypothetical protein
VGDREETSSDIKQNGDGPMLKKIAIGVVVLLVIIAGVVSFLFSNLDSIVKAAIEKYGSAATQAEVKLDSVKLAITSGEGSLNGLTVGNPKGFSSPKAIYMGLISVKLDTNSVTGNGPIIIREIVIDKPQVTYEITNSGDSNLQSIQRNTMTYAGGGSSASTPASSGGGSSSGGSSSSGSSGGAQERKVIINDLYVRDGQIGVSAALLQGKTMTTALPTIHLTNIGKDRDGATPAQVAQQVLSAITATAAKAASTDLAKQLGPLKDALGGGGGNVTDQMKGLLGR